jgi:creatinine amidohydrolase
MACALSIEATRQADVILAPIINYSYYPAFVEYAGSTSLRPETARDLVIDVVKSLAHHGPRRFYVLNTGVSTVKPLNAAQELLAAGKAACDGVEEQHEGTHADKIETSMMLALADWTVDMSKATKDFPMGEEVVACVVKSILTDIEALRASPLPAAPTAR